MSMLDRPIADENTPLRHGDVRMSLARELAEGHYPVGSRFPSETELQARFGIGRHTAREALKTLADEGFIDRRRKSGTIVLTTMPGARYSQPLGSLHNLLDFGFETWLQVHAFAHVRLHDDRLCDLLKVPPGLRWLRVTGVRVRRDTNVPVCWSEHYLPPSYGFERDALDTLEGPIHAMVASRHGFEVDHVDQEIGAGHVTAAVAGLLCAEVASPALLVVRRYHRAPSGEAKDEMSTLTQAVLNLFPAGRYWVRSRIERDR
jgi:DNA-binding GntR family transcriptional regulator